MMGKKSKIHKEQVETVSLGFLVPKKHMVRKHEKTIDLSFIYELVAELYSPYGVESIDPGY